MEQICCPCSSVQSHSRPLPGISPTFWLLPCAASSTCYYNENVNKPTHSYEFVLSGSMLLYLEMYIIECLTLHWWTLSYHVSCQPELSSFMTMGHVWMAQVCSSHSRVTLGLGHFWQLMCVSAQVHVLNTCPPVARGHTGARLPASMPRTSKSSSVSGRQIVAGVHTSVRLCRGKNHMLVHTHKHTWVYD